MLVCMCMDAARGVAKGKNALPTSLVRTLDDSSAVIRGGTGGFPMPMVVCQTRNTSVFKAKSAHFWTT